jgi:hypothetical protein
VGMIGAAGYVGVLFVFRVVSLDTAMGGLRALRR